MTQAQLKQGQHLFFDNEQWCEDNLSDDIRCGFITFHQRFQLFAIHFNGTCIHTSRTFSSAKKRLNKLMGDWNCEFNANPDWF